MRISDWSSDVCSSDLRDDENAILERNVYGRLSELLLGKQAVSGPKGIEANAKITQNLLDGLTKGQWWQVALQNEKAMAEVEALKKQRSEEHTSELQSLMRISYAVFCLKKKKNKIEEYDGKSTCMNNIKEI